MNKLAARKPHRLPAPPLRTLSALAIAAAVVLTGCTPEPSDTDPTADGDSNTSVESPTPTEAVPDSPPQGEPNPTGSSTADGDWGAYENRADACAAVATDVVAVALLPMSLTLGGSEEDVDNSEDKVETMKEAAPPGLTADFARVQLLIDSFGERLAAGERGGGDDIGSGGDGGEDGSDLDDGDSGTGGDDGGSGSNGTGGEPSGEPSEEAADEPTFDGEALNEALAPVKEWLTENCEGTRETDS